MSTDLDRVILAGRLARDPGLQLLDASCDAGTPGAAAVGAPAAGSDDDVPL